jgi:hypothetical protein
LIEFRAWPKIARLNRDITITEKIDGTNAAIGVVEVSGEAEFKAIDPFQSIYVNDGTRYCAVYAQSRKNIITPERDNFGFAKWVWGNGEELARVLGPGLHFGEWWGSGIQRGYGLTKGDKRFSLFNTKRWAGHEAELANAVSALRVVPILYEGPFDREKLSDRLAWYREELADFAWPDALNDLRLNGSKAAPGFMNPEGIVMYHQAANLMFKVTLENDEAPKEVVKHRQEAA